jgi:hypothetical protein
MNTKILALSVLGFSLLAVPATLAQGYYDRGYEAPISGAQMTDWPSSRANTTLSGSFLRPNVRDEYGYGRGDYRHDDRDRYDYDRDRRDYDRDRQGDDAR